MNNHGPKTDFEYRVSDDEFELSTDMVTEGGMEERKTLQHLGYMLFAIKERLDKLLPPQ